METYLYLTLMPEELIASMLPPKDFGAYRAVGREETTHSPDIFFEVAPLDKNEVPFPLENIEKRCVPHSDGSPKRSVYRAIYRVLEQIPLNKLKNVYFTTRDGRVLELAQGKELPSFEPGYHLYQELSPAHPQIASTLNPIEYIRYLTEGNENLYVPKICFVDLRLGILAKDIDHGEVVDLPYSGIEHLRNCLKQLRVTGEKKTKTVDRIPPQSFPYRAIKNGLYVGSSDDILYYPFPSHDEFQTKYYQWWRSATLF